MIVWASLSSCRLLICSVSGLLHRVVEIKKVDENTVIQTKLFVVEEILCLLAMALGAVVCHPALDAALAWSSWGMSLSVSSAKTQEYEQQARPANG